MSETDVLRGIGVEWKDCEEVIQILRLLLLLLLFAQSVLRVVRSSNFFKLLSVVAVVLVNIKGKFNFFFGLGGG